LGKFWGNSKQATIGLRTEALVHAAKICVLT
jgi:hypothetical protein